MGTSSCRACAVDEQGCKRALHAVPFAPIRTEQGGSYYEADALLKIQEQVLSAVLEEVGAENVRSLAVSSQRSTVVLWDSRSGKSIAPILTWEDGRAAEQVQQVSLSQARVHYLTGLYKTPYFSAPKIAWCISHIPQVAAALKAGTLRVAPLASFLVYGWTKGAVFATDPTLAQRTLLFDIHSGSWSEELCNAFHIPLSVLPQLKSSVDDYGWFEYKGVKIPIRVCVADQQAAAAHLQAGQTCMNYGTGAFVLRHTGTEKIICDGLLTSVTANTPSQPFEFLLEGPITSAGSAFMWLKAQKGIDIEMSRLDKMCARATHPVRILPAVGGLGAPYWNFTVSPVCKPLTDNPSAADWAAGLAQAIGFLVADIGAYLKVNNAPIEKDVFVSGGLSNSRYLMQFQADLLQVPLTVQAEAEGTLRGLAQLAFQNLQLPSGHKIFPRISKQESSEKHRQWQVFLQACLSGK